MAIKKILKPDTSASVSAHKQAKAKNEIKAGGPWNWIGKKSDAEIDAYVSTSIKNIADAKQAVSNMAKLLARLIRANDSE